MAAQPNAWGTMSDRAGGLNFQTRSRRETAALEWQKYRQPKTDKEEMVRVFLGTFLDSQSESPAAFGNNPSDVAEDDALPSILSSIDGLLTPIEDSGDLAATEFAYRSARAIVESAYGRLRVDGKHLASRLPAPFVTSDDRGGVRLSWQRGDRHVRTTFGSSEEARSYLYFESLAEHNVETLQPSALSSRLEWMLEP